MNDPKVVADQISRYYTRELEQAEDQICAWKEARELCVERIAQVSNGQLPPVEPVYHSPQYSESGRQFLVTCPACGTPNLLESSWGWDPACVRCLVCSDISPYAAVGEAFDKGVTL